jgi:hypothetical protein
MGFISEFRRAYSGEGEFEGGRYSAGGVVMRCAQCGGEDFDKGSALPNTAGMTFLGFDWANKEATLLLCTNCSHITWFLNEPDRM